MSGSLFYRWILRLQRWLWLFKLYVLNSNRYFSTEYLIMLNLFIDVVAKLYLKGLLTPNWLLYKLQDKVFLVIMAVMQYNILLQLKKIKRMFMP